MSREAIDLLRLMLVLPPAPAPGHSREDVCSALGITRRTFDRRLALVREMVPVYRRGRNYYLGKAGWDFLEKVFGLAEKPEMEGSVKKNRFAL